MSGPLGTDTARGGGPSWPTPSRELGAAAARPPGARPGSGRRQHADGLATLLGAEGDRTADEREQRVVAAAADAVTGVEVRAALADDDLARADQLAAEALDTQALGVAVATVARRGRALLVCHV